MASLFEQKPSDSSAVEVQTRKGIERPEKGRSRMFDNEIDWVNILQG